MTTFGSIFSGGGGFDLGLEMADWECLWQVEWDKDCQDVLQNNWPDTLKYTDVTDVDGHDLIPVDAVSFGSPCQDLSVAGTRKGLEGDRSGMFFEAVRVIKEMRNATGNQYPQWVIWENVVGALTSRGGEDFEAVLTEMAKLGADYIEWAVLNAEHFGVPQHRRRVFVVAHLHTPGREHNPTQIFPLSQGGSRNPSTRTRQHNPIGGSANP